MRKAFILGAGLGTRLQPLTNTLPKPLIPLHNRPLITHAIDHCLAAGITDIAINTHHLPHTWSEKFPENRYREAHLTFFHEPILLETGGGIKNIASWINNEPILIYNGDILTDIRIDKLITAHMASNNNATLAVRSSGPALHLALDGRKITDIHGKLTEEKGTHQFTGIYCIDPDLLTLIPENEKISVIPAFLESIKQNALGAYLADSGEWLDLGTHESYRQAAFSQSPQIHPTAKIHPTAIIKNSWIDENVTIGENTTITDSIIWPNVTIPPHTTLTQEIISI